MSPILEAGASSQAPIPKRPWSSTLAKADRASGSKRPRTSEAFEFQSSAKIQLEGANWTVRGKLAKLGGDLKGKLPFKVMVDLIDHKKLQMKRDISTRGMAEEMLSFQFFVSVLVFAFFSFHNEFLSNVMLFQLQGFLRSLLIYCYFRKVLITEEAETWKKRLEEVERENAKLKEAVAKMEEALQILSQHSAVMECEAPDAAMAQDKAEAQLGKLSEELKSLQVEHIELQEDHSILKEDLVQLEEKHSSTLEQLNKT